MKRYFKYIRRYLAYFILGPVMILAEVMGELYIPRLMALIIDNGVANHDIGYILKIAAIMAAVCIPILLGGILGSYFSVKASVYATSDLRNDLFHKIQGFSFADIDRFSTGSLVTRLTNDIQQVQQLIIVILKMMLRYPGMLVGAFIMALQVNRSIALTLLAVIPLLGISNSLIMRAAYPRFEKMQDALDRLNSGIQETLANIRIVKSFVREEHEQNRFDTLNTGLQKKSVSALVTVILRQPVLSLFMNATSIAVVWFGGNRIIAGQMQVGELTAFISYVTQILIALIMLSVMVLQSSRAMASISRISEVIDYEPKITDDNSCSKGKSVESGSIEFKHVYFTYGDTAAGCDAMVPQFSEISHDHKMPGRQTISKADSHAADKDTDGAMVDTMILKDISFKIESGETVGILGATGCGKTSMVQLIPRLYDVSSGEVLVDGTDVRDYSMHELRESVAMVLQYNMLFSGTIAENLRWGDENASDEEVRCFAAYAQADGFISDMDGDYDRLLEQGGQNLSGGQKQRLCIARALLKKPKILILDDSTSAVDTATEKRINEVLANELKDTTKLIISQRIGSVKAADNIIVMDDGRICDIGNHDELMARCGIYREIYYSQIDIREEETV